MTTVWSCGNIKKGKSNTTKVWLCGNNKTGKQRNTIIILNIIGKIYSFLIRCISNTYMVKSACLARDQG